MLAVGLTTILCTQTIIILSPMQALSEALPAVASKKIEKGGYMVLRPDSGDPTEAVLMVCCMVCCLASIT